MDLETSMTLVAPVLAIVAGIDIRSMVVIAAMMTTFPFLAFAERGPAPDMVTCAAPFGRESTRSDLVRAFGAANVVDKEIEIQEGSVRPGTVVYPNNPRSRLEIFLIGKPTRNPLIIRISGESQWTGWRGVHIGMTLEEIEGLNGRPFKLKRYDTAARGVVASTAWLGGAMERIPGGCQIAVDFMPADDAPSNAVAELAEASCLPIQRFALCG